MILRGVNPEPLTSALGQKQTSVRFLPPKADGLEDAEQETVVRDLKVAGNDLFGRARRASVS